MESKAEAETPSWPTRRGVLPPIGSQTERAAGAAERGTSGRALPLAGAPDKPSAGATASTSADGGEGEPHKPPMMGGDAR